MIKNRDKCSGKPLKRAVLSKREQDDNFRGK